MEQTNMVMAMYQAMASQGMVPKVNTEIGRASCRERVWTWV